MKSATSILLVGLSLACSRSVSAPVPAGQALFRQRCSVCHLTGSAGAQGPGLGGVVAVAVPNATERREVISYLATLRFDAANAQVQVHENELVWTAAAPGMRTGAAATGDFRTDGPGVRRRITVGDLPAPLPRRRRATARASSRSRQGGS